ncbi:MAG: hypothetical protein GY835_08540 [bacterium]|nr:hypothetical protein [bacterium]
MNNPIKVIATLCLLTLAGLQALADEPFIAISCTDYQTAGKLSICEPDNPWTATNDVATVHSDAVLGWSGGLLYVVNRLGADNVQVLDPDQEFATILQYSVVTASGPQCILFNGSGTKALLPRQERNDVLIIDPQTGTELAVIDLSGWADADGNAEVGQGVVIGDYAYVAIGRLNRDYYWSPVGDSYLAVIDLDDNTLVDVDPRQAGVQAIPLQATNPAWEIIAGPDGMIYCSCVGNYGLNDGGIERVNPHTWRSEGLVIDEAALGGDVNDFRIVDAGSAFVVVSDSGYNTHFKHFNLATGGQVTTVEAGVGYAFTDMEIDGSGDLYLCDRSYGNEGLRVYDAATGDLLKAAFSLGLPPYDIFIPGSTTGVDEPVPFATNKLAVWPNPFNPATTIAWSGLPDGPARLEIFDVAGRLIFAHELGTQEGAGQTPWAGIGDDGLELAGGVYLARVRCGNEAQMARLVLLK